MEKHRKLDWIIFLLFIGCLVTTSVDVAQARDSPNLEVVDKEEATTADRISSTPLENRLAAKNEAVAQQNTPDALISNLYRLHRQNKGPFSEGATRALIDKYFEKSLADMIWKDTSEAKTRGRYGAIDFDPLYNTQDPVIKNFSINKSKINKASAEVKVSFTNDRHKEVITFLLIQQAGTWKISDIKYQDSSLVGIYKEYAQQNP